MENELDSSRTLWTTLLEGDNAMNRKFSCSGLKASSSSSTPRWFKYSLLLLTAFLIALLVTPLYRAHYAAGEGATNEASTVQIAKPWTAIGSTGAIDELSIPAFAVSGHSLGFKAGSTATLVVARYNVTNTFDNNANPNVPGWVNLELTSTAPAGSSVSAKLVKVHRCDGVVTTICTATNVGGGGPKCDFCKFAPATIDFSNDLYYVEVTLSRAGAAMPLAHALRIF